ncbi:rad51 domain-containing protein [Trichonephila inaurata madagascariensis]|uniref:Rad51 domain-containing protein n=1 Tax=Trichonephila inaurata madagascariensis TaxID=2747483 RepID=A0A8X7CEL2_9ARAC|nr:rad51 domain-containing protein [Trichonephila inaurata madagascariensis]
MEDKISHFPLDTQIIPCLSTQDIVEISGGPGSGKTELLYHLIICCILPEIPLRGIQLVGLNKRVTFIDNDLHFNLFRLIKILEKRIRSQLSPNNYSVSRSEISSFIDDRLKLLDIYRCSNCDEFINILRYIEIVPKQKCLLIVDGMTSFYWSSKMRMTHPSSKIPDFFSIMSSLVKNISKSCSLPVIVTKRKLMQSSNYDRNILPAAWRNAVTKQLELNNNCLIENALNVIVHDITSEVKIKCAINSYGFKACH